MLQPEYARQRQRRLLEVMDRLRLDAVVVGLAHHVYYLGAYVPFWLHHAAFVLFHDGRSLLVCGRPPESDVAADRTIEYESNWLGTQRQEQPSVIADHLGPPLAGMARVGVDTSAVTAALARTIGAEAVPVDEDLWQLRRRKDPDELSLMKRAIDCTRAMHARAREIIEPGVPEVRIFSALHEAAVAAAGEPLSPMHLGNDFRCGAPGGPPRQERVARAGELYILDLGPAFRGYFADNSRVYAVHRKPTDAQLAAWRTVIDVFPIVERLARPGVRCREIFAAVDEHYRRATGAGLPHHLGHGVGLQPHEFPHLNPRWDDVLQEGEVFTCEPGLYAPELAAGLRIENQYLVTATGVENLTPFPLGLA